MLRDCIIHFDKSWDKCLAWAEFSYNNSYQASLKMAPFEALYGRRCCTPFNWSQVGERKFFGPNLVKEAEERVEVIKENLKAAQMRQKSYHDKGKTVREYQVGKKVYLRVSPKKGVQRFGVKDTLALMRLLKFVDPSLIAFAYPSSLLLYTTCSTCLN
jgi:hypothetical protein